MRWLQIRCDLCGHVTTMQQDHWTTSHWGTHEGMDVCPGCMWDLEAGHAPQVRPHPTVRPLPPGPVDGKDAA
jgi:hypothetical protein